MRKRRKEGANRSFFNTHTDASVIRENIFVTQQVKLAHLLDDRLFRWTGVVAEAGTKSVQVRFDS